MLTDFRRDRLTARGPGQGMRAGLPISSVKRHLQGPGAFSEEKIGRVCLRPLFPGLSYSGQGWPQMPEH